MRSGQDHSACFLLGCCFPIYPTTSIMTCLTTEIKVLECSECGLDSTLTRCSGRLFWIKPFPECCGWFSLKNQNLTLYSRPPFGLIFVFSFHHMVESVRNIQAHVSWSHSCWWLPQSQQLEHFWEKSHDVCTTQNKGSCLISTYYHHHHHHFWMHEQTISQIDCGNL